MNNASDFGYSIEGQTGGASGQKFWCGDAPEKCDICKGNFHTPGEEIFVDGVTIMGPWANMCASCHFDMGRGLGTGRGQKYKKQPDGRWMKIAG